MGGRLQAQDRGVVAGGDGAGAEELLVDLDHGVQRIDPPGDQPALYAVLLEGSASGIRRPLRTVAAASRTTASVIRLSVPISSSAPQRPQLLTRFAMSWNSAAVTWRLLGLVLVDLMAHKI